MCSFDGRSGINTGVIPRERNKRALKDHLDEWWSLDARSGDHTSRLAECQCGYRVKFNPRVTPLARPACLALHTSLAKFTRTDEFRFKCET
jgi:hypothetical protein